MNEDQGGRGSSILRDGIAFLAGACAGERQYLEASGLLARLWTREDGIGAANPAGRDEEDQRCQPRQGEDGMHRGFTLGIDRN